jgi:hypothetical protein
MDRPIYFTKTVDVIEKMRLGKIGDSKKWNSMIKKINNKQSLNISDLAYFTNLTRIYKELNPSPRSRIYHTKLSNHDEKPACKICGGKSDFYCNMNDQYFCMIHVVGHDENEF